MLEFDFYQFVGICFFHDPRFSGVKKCKVASEVLLRQQVVVWTRKIRLFQKVNINFNIFRFLFGLNPQKNGECRKDSESELP